MEKKYKPLNMFTAQTTELKRLIGMYPDYPIVILVDSDVVADDGYNWWYAPRIDFTVGELLDCEQDVNNEKTYIDRDDFKEDLETALSWDDENDDLTDEEFDALVEKKFSEYEPYWKKVIIVRAMI